MDDLEKAVEDVIAFERFRMICDSVSKQANRRVSDISNGIYNRVSSGEKLPLDSEVIAYIKTDETTEKVRETKDALEMFSKEFPKEYARLKELIEESRKAKEIHLYFGHKENCYPTKEAHYRILRNLGIAEKDIAKAYEVADEVFLNLRKKKIESVLSKHIDLDKKETEKKGKK